MQSFREGVEVVTTSRKTPHLVFLAFSSAEAIDSTQQKNSREADHKQQRGDVGFGVFSYKVTLLACGSGPAQIVFLYSTIKLNIYFVSYTLSTRFSLFIYRITSTILIASSLQLLKFVSGEYRIVFIIFINKAFNHTKFFK